MNIREFLDSKNGKIASIAFAVVMVGAAGFAAYSQLGQTAESRMSTDRVFIDTQTGQTFRHTIAMGEKVPVVSPFTGKNTGVEPEKCFWTADGKIKSEPTYVLLNESAGKQGPTFCPDCGRLVVAHNPPASTLTPPPPTRAELAKH